MTEYLESLTRPGPLVGQERPPSFMPVFGGVRVSHCFYFQYSTETRTELDMYVWYRHFNKE